MYAFPILLPEFSNREDLTFLLSLFDDDSGEPIDFSGRTAARPGNYTNNFWGVTVGNWTTFSGSVLTIPDYPIGDELTAVALTVDANLPIMPGDPITIFDLPGGASVVGPVGPPPTPIVGEDGTTYYVTEDSTSGLAPPQTWIPGPNQMSGYVTSYKPQNGALVAQIGCTFQLELRRQFRQSEWDYYDGYTAEWDMGSVGPVNPIINAQLGQGLTMIDVGILQVRIPESVIRKLSHVTYQIGLTVTDSYDTRQVAVMQLPMQHGGVSR